MLQTIPMSLTPACKFCWIAEHTRPTPLRASSLPPTCARRRWHPSTQTAWKLRAPNSFQNFHTHALHTFLIFLHAKLSTSNLLAILPQNDIDWVNQNCAFQSLHSSSTLQLLLTTLLYWLFQQKPHICCSACMRSQKIHNPPCVTQNHTTVIWPVAHLFTSALSISLYLSRKNTVINGLTTSSIKRKHKKTISTLLLERKHRCLCRTNGNWPVWCISHFLPKTSKPIPKTFSSGTTSLLKRHWHPQWWYLHTCPEGVHAALAAMDSGCRHH